MTELMNDILEALPSHYTLYLHNYAVGVMIIKNETTGEAFRINIRHDYI